MKGSPIITFRISPLLMRRLALYLEKRGDMGHVNAMDRTAFIVKAIEEKLDKHERAAKKPKGKTRAPSVARPKEGE